MLYTKFLTNSVVPPGIVNRIGKFVAKLLRVILFFSALYRRGQQCADTSHFHMVGTTERERERERERAISGVICGQFSTVNLKFKLSTYIHETFLFLIFLFFFLITNQTH